MESNVQALLEVVEPFGPWLPGGPGWLMPGATTTPQGPSCQDRVGAGLSTPRLRASETLEHAHFDAVTSYRDRRPEVNGHSQVSRSPPSHSLIYETSVPCARFPLPRSVPLAENDRAREDSLHPSVNNQEIARFDFSGEPSASRPGGSLAVPVPVTGFNSRNIRMTSPSSAHQRRAFTADNLPAKVSCESPTG
jgi:hypothetical protein